MKLIAEVIGETDFKWSAIPFILKKSITMVDSKCSGMGPTSIAIDGAKKMSRQRQIMLSCDRIPIKEQFLYKIMKFICNIPSDKSCMYLSNGCVPSLYENG